MNILLLEDSSEKAQAITKVIKSIDDTLDRYLEVVTDLNAAKQKLKEKKYNLFIADIQVPTRFGESPKKDVGFELIYKLSQKTKGYNLPNHIIAITEYEKIFEEYNEHLNNKLISFIKYDNSTTLWSENLQTKIEYINQSINEFNIGIEYEYDLAIICALDDPELKYIKKFSNKWERIEVPNTSIPFEKTVLEFTDKKLNILAVSIDKMGMVASAVLSTQIIELFRPKYLAMTGIAAGIKNEVNLGDILIANPSWDSGSGKLKKDSIGNGIFEIDPKQEPLDNDIENNLLELSKDSQLLNSIREEWDVQKIDSILNVHIGPIASGAAVIADNEITEKIKQQSRKIIGIEMEAYGVFYAASHATNPKPKPLVIKSVCDFADETKSDGFQNYAAYTSSKFLYEFAKRYI